MVDRLVASQGANAKAKESQAAVKALEGILSAYRANLIPAPTAEGFTTHKGIDELERLCNGCLEVIRMNAHDVSTETISTKVVDRMFEKHNGLIGWLPARTTATSSSETNVAVTSENIATVENNEASVATTANITEPATDNTNGGNVFDTMPKEKLDLIAKMSEKVNAYTNFY